MAIDRLNTKVVLAVKHDAYRYAEQFKGLLSPIGGDLGIKRIAEAFMMGALHENKRARLAKLKKEARKRDD